MIFFFTRGEGGGGRINENPNLRQKKFFFCLLFGAGDWVGGGGTRVSGGAGGSEIFLTKTPKLV